MGEEEYSKFLFWNEYVSNDMEETNAFLHEMFGWKVFVKAEHEIYLKYNETPIMNIVQRSAEMERDGVPPHVKNYITVADYDESLSLAQKNGAELIHEAEVPDYFKLDVLKIPGDIYLAIVHYYKGEY